MLQAQITGRAVDLDAYDIAEYAVSYVAASQRQLADASIDAALATRQPLSRVEIAGIPYAEVYALDRPAFGEGLRLGQVAMSPSLTTRGANVSVQLARGMARRAATLRPRSRWSTAATAPRWRPR